METLYNWKFLVCWYMLLTVWGRLIELVHTVYSTPYDILHVETSSPHLDQRSWHLQSVFRKSLYILYVRPHIVREYEWGINTHELFIIVCGLPTYIHMPMRLLWASCVQATPNSRIGALHYWNIVLSNTVHSELIPLCIHHSHFLQFVRFWISITYQAGCPNILIYLSNRNMGNI